MKLISEINENVNVKVVSEEATNTKNYFIEGIFMSYDIKNRNGRIYPKEVLMREMTRYSEDNIAKKRSMGELGHSNGPSVVLERVSHIITDLWNEGTHIYGRAKILDTPYGKIAKNLIDEGVQLGVSTRGLGNIKQTSNGNIVENDYRLSTVDIVSDPSAPDAFVNGIMEGREYVYLDTGVIVEKDLAKIKESIHSATNARELMENKVKAFEKLMSSLSKI
jgi:Prohead core protein serine protease